MLQAKQLIRISIHPETNAEKAYNKRVLKRLKNSEIEFAYYEQKDGKEYLIYSEFEIKDSIDLAGQNLF